MKILHTSDWHIGKRLYEKDLIQDHRAFFDWLNQYIGDNDIDILLVSGDVFDLANPSSESRKLYYQTLSELAQHQIKIIITAGNHDSPLMLAAPKEILEALDIHVVSHLGENLCIPIRKGDDNVVVGAIPYIRDNELRSIAPAQFRKERQQAVQKGVKEIYDRLAHEVESKYPDAFAIAMGHLYVQHVKTSESERTIQCGNLAGVSADIFSEVFDYVALGHIHKPQSPQLNRVYYSGSPLPLSFSEKEDQKQVIEIEIQKNELKQISIVPIPAFRKLVKIKGDLSHVIHQLEQLNQSKIPSYIEIELVQEKADITEVIALDERMEVFNETNENVKILKSRTQVKSDPDPNPFHVDNISELKPQEVFDTWIQQQEFNASDTAEIQEAFETVLNDYYQSSNP